MNNVIEVLIIEDHVVVRNGLRLLFEANQGFEICGEAGSIEGAIKLAKTISPNVILLDLKLPDAEGIEGYKRTKAAFPKSSIMVLTAYVDRYSLKELIREGLKGLFLKKIDGDGLLEGVRKVNLGEYAIDPAITGEVFGLIQTPMDNPYTLNDKEIKILELISEGKMNKEIAPVLLISEKTVRNYISMIYKKLHVANRTEAASIWIRRNGN